MLPDELMREVRRLRIGAKRRVDDLFAGEYHSAFRGQGIEFAEVREYEPGDDVRSIDWNVTARAGRPFIKRFTEERELTVVLCVDLSASQGFGTRRKTKARLAAEAAAVLSLAASKNNDRVGLLTFRDELGAFLPPAKGQQHQLRLIRELLAVEAHGRATALPEAVSFLDRVLKRRSIVFLLGDFLLRTEAEAEALDLPLRLLARRHEVIALRTLDPAERALPAIGLIEFEDPETGRRVLFDAGSRRARRSAERRAAEENARLGELLRRAGVDLVELSTDRPLGDDLAAYFHRRGAHDGRPRRSAR